jgi:RimJ/RimL family protein N-acetyltransferase
VLTDRLDLRPVAMNDLGALFAINNDPDTWRHDPPGRHLTPDRTRAWIERAALKWDLDGLSYWTVRLRSDDTTIGVGGVQRQPFGWNLYYRFPPTRGATATPPNWPAPPSPPPGPTNPPSRSSRGSTPPTPPPAASPNA